MGKDAPRVEVVYVVENTGEQRAGEQRAGGYNVSNVDVCWCSNLMI